jgi:superfamily II DNA or RNA helicase
MVPLAVRNDFASFPAATPPDLVKAVDRLTSYEVQGKQFVEAFKKHWWDGKEHLLKLSQRRGEYLMPTGVLDLLLKSKLAGEFEVRDERRRPAERREFTWTGHPPRDYQAAAVAAAIADRGVLTGRGLLHLPIRAGKTLVAGKIIHETGLRTLFTVPSELLLTQTARALREYIADAPVGVCGGGVWEPDWITVATVQTLLARPQAAHELLRQVDLLFFDEGHHLEAPEWRKPVLQCDAFYKIALSATVWANPEEESERGAIWLRAATGPILHKVSMQRLIELGHLVPPVITVYPVEQPANVSPRSSYSSAYRALVEESEYRNSAVADLAEGAALRGYRVLVDTGRLKQMRRIREMLRARGFDVEEMSGKTSDRRRQEILADFRAKKVQIVVGTILGEGVDIPELEVVINAEAMKSKTSVIQRMRNLTECAGKTRAHMLDFADLTHPILANHSSDRLALYRGVRGFTVRSGKVAPGGKYLFED